MTTYIGAPTSRIDGRTKVTGEARYAAEFTAPGLTYGSIVSATIAKGHMTSIDSRAALAVDGVIATLRERLLIFEVGRAELVGRPMQYGTTAAFLEYFGLGRIEDLPAADELRRIPVQRPESLLTVENTPPEFATDPAQAQLPMEPLDPAVEVSPVADSSGNATPAVSLPTEPAESAPPAM
jgi:hypothetical protein